MSSVRFHRPLTDAVEHTLQLIFDEGWYADKALEKTMRQNPKWGARDRAFIAQTTYNIVRYHSLYAFVANSSEHTHTLAAYLWHTYKTLPPWDDFPKLHTPSLEQQFIKAQDDILLRESVPLWMHQLADRELGAQWQTEIHALNQEAEVYLRTNSLRTDRQKLADLLATEQIPTTPVPHLPHALQLTQRKNIFASHAFKTGLFEVQDAASQMVAPFLQVAPGMTVVDACAGAGGKTLHLAALMQNKGQIIALDPYENKLAELRKRAIRCGADLVRTQTITSSKITKRLADRADRLLLDVPCSGMGVLRRNPDAKWKLSPEFIQTVQQTQRDILQQYSRMLKPKGELVYATCSILPSENEAQVAHFIAQNPTFVLAQQQTISPAQSGYDGFFMARIVRTQ
jgi:16S rRNA (cytosine967-C5)-methyltransferase